MEKLMLKNTDIEVSRLCFGGCPMGGHGWGDVSRNELITAVQEALDAGVNFFDSADVYGLGEGERTLAEALGDKRGEAVIATKFGVRVENGKTFYDNSPEWINQALEASLKRMNTDYIDLYQVHYRDGITPIEDVIEALEAKKKAGYIRSYGLSNIHLDDIPVLKSFRNRFTTFQDEYSLATRKNENDLIEISKALELTPMTWGSLGQGILTGKYDKDTRFDTNDRRSRDIYVNFHGDKLLHNLEIVEVMRQISKSIDKTIASIAIRWILDHLSDSVVIAGIKNSRQLQSNVSALGWHLSEADLNALDNIAEYKEETYD